MVRREPPFRLPYPGLWSIPMMSLFLIASAILLPFVASAKYYCDSGITMCCTNTTTVCVMSIDSKKALKHAKFWQANTTAADEILDAYSISESGLSGFIGYGCSVIKNADNGSVSACINETACCTGQYYVRHRRFIYLALTFDHRAGALLSTVLPLWASEGAWTSAWKTCSLTLLWLYINYTLMYFPET